MARALITSSAKGAASNAYASFLVLSDHARARKSSASDSARRTSELSEAVRAQATAIVTAVRLVATLDTSMENGQRARIEGERLQAALFAVIQADYGGLSQDLRQAAYERRKKSSGADAAASTAFTNASAFQIKVRDPLPEPGFRLVGYDQELSRLLAIFSGWSRFRLRFESFRMVAGWIQPEF